MRHNLIYLFHAIIIASIFFSFVGCGYKTPPRYIPPKSVQK